MRRRVRERRAVRSKWSRTARTSSPAATRWSPRRSARAGDVRVDLDGTDVTSAFAVRAERPLRRARDRAEGRRATRSPCAPARGGKRITITNHPIGGPVFAGPQVTPYACNPNASTPPLGPALDAQCNAPTRVELLYRNAAGQFVAYDPANPPADDPDDHDRLRPHRAVHRRARHRHRRPRHLPDARRSSTRRSRSTPWSAEQPWSRKLFYTFGGACGTEHRQLAPPATCCRRRRSAPASSSPPRA